MHMQAELEAIKQAKPDHEIQPLLAARWSPSWFSSREVPLEDLRALFEAARWAPSSYNEQPWRYLVATRDQTEAFEKLLSCLSEGNQAWARHAPVLALGVISLRFAHNDKENRAAPHDLGLAAGNLCVEATARGLCVHQMIGIQPERARELYGIPAGYAAFTGLAIGYPGDPEDPQAPAKLVSRDRKPRTRHPLPEFVFGAWGQPVSWV